jgi:agmatinase
MNATRIQKRTALWAGLNQPDTKAADIVVIGIPYDGAACFRSGAAEGPGRIRRLSSEIPPVLETGESLCDLVIRDDGDLSFDHDFSKSHPQVIKTIQNECKQSFLLTLGGDHSVAIPVHRGFSQGAKHAIGLVFIDAHTDLSNQFQGSSYSNACPLRRTLECQKFSDQNTILVGTRCFEASGRRYIEKHHMTCFPAFEIEDRGMSTIASEIIKQLSGSSNVYLSIDIDVLDPAFAPGTGMPDAGGLTTRDLITLITMLDALPVVGADLVEVSPPLDSSDITGFAALKCITALFGLVYRRKMRKLRYTLL